jgi:hypothetical protein
MRQIIALIALLAAAPAQAGDRGLNVVGDDRPVSLSMRVQAQVNGSPRALAAGDTLKSGDRLELLLDVDAPAFVYVMQVFPDGSSAVLFPKDGDVEVKPGTSTRLPAAGQWFQLDDVTGTENLVVFASTRTLKQAAPEAHQVVAEVRRPPRPRKPGAPKAPGALSLKSRGILVVGTDEGKTLKARTDEQGVAIFRFSFQHAAR